MEVSGIEGNYRLTCEKVMRVLRENNDSLVATLEAFVHDPLISWRLLNIDRYLLARLCPCYFIIQHLSLCLSLY